MGKLQYNTGAEVQCRNVDSALIKVQTLCKVIRKEVCNMSMKTMGEYCGLSVPAISAWESGRANNVNYMFFYYDIIQGEEWKKMFLDICFNSDGKNVDLTVYRHMNTKTSSCRYKIYECEEGKKPVFNIQTVKQMGV